MCPLVVPRVRKQLAERFGASDAAIKDWAGHWFREGLGAYEAQLVDGATRCHGAQFTIADIALASHLIGAARFGIDLAPYPRVQAIGASITQLPFVAAAHPDLQRDAPKNS